MPEVAVSVRQTNLLLALNLCLQNQRPLTAEWAMRNVEGYLPELAQRLHPAEQTIATVRKRLQRDVAAWREAGIPISGDITQGYELSAQEAFLPAIDFTPQELEILAQVTTMAVNSSLSEHARLGLLKLLSQVAWDEETSLDTAVATAPAATSKKPHTPKIQAMVDWNTSDPTDIAQLSQAIQHHQVVSFRYYTRATDPATAPERHLVPWALVSHHNRLYVVGWDLEQQAQRLFRFARMHQLHNTNTTGTPAPADFDGPRAVADWFDSHDDRIDARISYAGHDDLLLLEEAKKVSATEYELTGVSRRWLLHQAIAAAPDAVVTHPPELREEIRSSLALALEQLGVVHE